MFFGEDGNSGVRFKSDPEHEDAISCLQSPFNCTPLFASFTRSKNKLWVSHVTWTPKMSQNWSKVHGMTQLRYYKEAISILVLLVQHVQRLVHKQITFHNLPQAVQF